MKYIDCALLFLLVIAYTVIMFRAGYVVGRCRNLQDMIAKKPPVQPEQKTGWWELDRFDDGETVRCSECNKYFVKESKYCPNCGAKMEVKE